jgi:8-oxo-dGTP diphosphatase
MSSPYCYKYPRPAVTVDLVVFAWIGGALRILLIRRAHDPFAGRWSLPGGFLDINEPEDVGARRELLEETGLVVSGPIAPIGFFAKPGRDPRGRTVTLAHATVLPPGEHAVQGGDDAAEAAWRALDDPLVLAFDHDEILAVAKSWLRHGLLEGDLGSTLLPGPIALADAQAVFRALDIPVRNARRWAARLSNSDAG